MDAVERGDPSVSVEEVEPAASAVPTANHNVQVIDELVENQARLENMGFGAEEVTNALQLAEGNLDFALEILTS
jgi:hypothetical protein